MYILGLSFVSFIQKLSVGKEVFILLFLEHQSKKGQNFGPTTIQRYIQTNKQKIE